MAQTEPCRELRSHTEKVTGLLEALISQASLRERES
jgi:hypothetical protein